MTCGVLAAAATVALALSVGTAATASRSVDSCDARPVVEQFFAALKAGDVARLDALFARGSERWNWYSVADPAGQRFSPEARNRSTLRAYFASRIAQQEQFRLVQFDGNENGNFGLLVERRADDLRGGRWVRRQGKGWVNCAVGKLAVWSLGGAPPPRTFGPCPQGTLPLTRTDLPEASRAVLRFVRDVYSEMVPAFDYTGARVTRAALAAGNTLGYAARVRCSLAVQRRTAVVEVRFPRVAPSDRAARAFYASRTRAGWLVWRLVP